MNICVRVGSALLALALCAGAHAQVYPSKPVTMIVPYAPGGTGEILGRSLAQKLSEILGQNVIVESRPGAGGNIGAEIVARNARADGYTVLFTATSLASNVSLMKKMPFDPLKDLVAIAPVAAIQTIAVVNPALPIQTIRELVAYARANPGKLSFGSSGIGTSNHLSVELFKVVAGVDILHVPYKSAGQALPDVISGQVNMMFDLMPSAINHVRQGRLRALAVTGAKRSPAAPDLPTVAEAGVPGYEFTAWFGLFAPAATPREVVTRLNAAVTRAIESPDLKARMEQQGAEPFAATPEQFAQFFKGEVDKWARVVREGRLAVQE
jgi:tripartite-type tricarboxylate transporter receptor subunit TctC